jgi:glycyl-tRNA synthetase beta chain
MPDFLLEIGCEEIPARMIDGARQELKRRIGELLQREHLSTRPEIQAFSTPRRLAVLVRAISKSQPDTQEQLKGPASNVAFSNGQPLPPAHAFASKAGVDVAALQRRSTPKGEYLWATVTRKGRSAAEVLSELLPKEIASLYWAKNMYWRAGKPERFVRPVRWIVALLDGEIVPLEFAAIRAGKKSRGHRILGRHEIAIKSAGSYADALADAKVVVDPAAREERVRKLLDKSTRTIPGARWRADDALKATVVNLTEYPGVVLGNFDGEFLNLPEEVLVTVMRDHQKYFAIEDANGKLLPHFLAVLNTEADPDGLIRHGNERVLRARFNDAQFFWNTDQKIPLRDRVSMLAKVTFQKDLGSYGAKSERTTKLAADLAMELRAAGREINEEALSEASRLAKTDLTTELVKEFTELQGIVGGLYARHQGLGEPVAQAIYDQYKPESMDDEIPRTLEGAVLSMADKADTIAGMFALGLQPSGSKDPFALRRQANAIVRILAEHNLPLRISDIFKKALAQYEQSNVWSRFKDVAAQPAKVSEFFRERLDFYLREKHGLAYDVVNAVLSAGADDVPDVLARAKAVTAVRGSDDFASIAIAFKRMKNILRQAREGGKKWPHEFSGSELREEQEKTLAAQVQKIAPEVEKTSKDQRYSEALALIAKLRAPIDLFFDKVMVMVEDERLRGNRLALLDAILQRFTTVADFSEIVIEGQ